MSDNKDEIFGWCKVCPIKSCVKEKEFISCYQCDKFPCRYIKRFPMPVGKKVIARAIPYWKEHGTEKYVKDEIERYHCPECESSLFRGAKRCNNCKNPVNVD